MKLQVFQLDGYDLFFHTREARWEPPHFHITKPGESWKLKVLFTECTSSHLELEIEPGHLPVDQLPLNKAKELREHIVTHQEALLRRWNEILGAQ